MFVRFDVSYRRRCQIQLPSECIMKFDVFFFMSDRICVCQILTFVNIDTCQIQRFLAQTLLDSALVSIMKFGVCLFDA